MIWFIINSVICFALGNVSMYYFMRGEVDEAWSTAARTSQEKEHYRLKYEQVVKRLRKL